MTKSPHSRLPFFTSLSFALICTLLVLLWIAGGTSRGDAIGQVVTRSAAWAILIVYIMAGPRPKWQDVTPVAIFLLAGTAVVALQLVPLPPSLWTGLPGRDLLAHAAPIVGQDQPWRPLSIAPGETANSLSSLIVPWTALVLLAALSHAERRRLTTLLLGLVFASSLLGLLQFSGANFDHPMVNDLPGAISGSFANRNHLALFVAIGCQLALVWGFQEQRGSRWKGPVALALLPLFGLIILATGSRTGVLLGVLGIGTGLLMVRRRIMSELGRLPRSGAIALAAGTLGLFVAAVALSVMLDRAVSFDRALSLEVGEDLRRQALPTVWGMTWTYFPVGTGMGTFDPAFRIAEPTSFLSLLYFNRAHTDLLEVVLETGLAGLLLLVAAIVWWLWMSVRAWTTNDGSASLLPRLGSAILLLVLVASAVDYPARTPMIMTLVVIAAVWLNGRADGKTGTG